MTKQELQQRVDTKVGRRVAIKRRTKSPLLTQDELASKTDGVLSRSAVANIESGRQRVAVYQLYAIADALDIAPSELLPDPKEIRKEGYSETEKKILRQLTREDTGGHS